MKFRWWPLRKKKQDLKEIVEKQDLPNCSRCNDKKYVPLKEGWYWARLFLSPIEGCERQIMGGFPKGPCPACKPDEAKLYGTEKFVKD